MTGTAISTIHSNFPAIHIIIKALAKNSLTGFDLSEDKKKQQRGDTVSHNLLFALTLWNLVGI